MKTSSETETHPSIAEITRSLWEQFVRGLSLDEARPLTGGLTAVQLEVTLLGNLTEHLNDLPADALAPVAEHLGNRLELLASLWTDALDTLAHVGAVLAGAPDGATRRTCVEILRAAQTQNVWHMKLLQLQLPAAPSLGPEAPEPEAEEPDASPETPPAATAA
jgi:hypothetical protein